MAEVSVRANDRRAVFVGAKAHTAADGSILRDLFQDAHEGWFEDHTLLDRLATQKLQVDADGVRAKGYKWVEISLDLPYGYHSGLRHLASTSAPISVEEESRHATLLAEYRSLETEHAESDEYSEKVDARLGDLEAAMDVVQDRPEVFEVADIERAGVFLTLDCNGMLANYRGFVRPEDEAPVVVEKGEANAESMDVDAVGSYGSQAAEPGALAQPETDDYQQARLSL